MYSVCCGETICSVVDSEPSQRCALRSPATLACCPQKREAFICSAAAGHSSLLCGSTTRRILGHTAQMTASFCREPSLAERWSTSQSQSQCTPLLCALLARSPYHYSSVSQALFQLISFVCIFPTVTGCIVAPQNPCVEILTSTVSHYDLI